MSATAVRGHLCDGLANFQNASEYGCIPRFGESGDVQGCDDVNRVRIMFCPFCGNKLPVLTAAQLEDDEDDD